MTAQTLERVYWRAYEQFYRWGSILRAARRHEDWLGALRHLAYSGGWKKFEPLWDWVIRSRQVRRARPLLEQVLSGFGRHTSRPRRLPAVRGRDERAPAALLPLAPGAAGDPPLSAGRR
jgi:hypothetical protein